MPGCLFFMRALLVRPSSPWLMTCCSPLHHFGVFFLPHFYLVFCSLDCTWLTWPAPFQLRPCLIPNVKASGHLPPRHTRPAPAQRTSPSQASLPRPVSTFEHLPRHLSIHSFVLHGPGTFLASKPSLPCGIPPSRWLAITAVALTPHPPQGTDIPRVSSMRRRWNDSDLRAVPDVLPFQDDCISCLVPARLTRPSTPH